MLRRSVNRNLRGILEKLPKTLDETYERVLKDINEDNRDHARRLLHCLAVAIRPLRVEELAEILAFDFDGAEGGIPKFRADWRSKDQERAVLSTCSSLITVVDGSDDFFGKCRVVQFSHFSVKEFLLSDRLASSPRDVSQYHIFPGPAHTILAQACLGFLLHLDNEETGKRFPLAMYAAKHWVAHAQFEDVASYVKNGMQSLFDPDKHHLMAWVGIYNIDYGWVPHTLNPVYYAALCGFHGIVERLVISHPQLINTDNDLYQFSVLAALYGEHDQVAELLLRHGGKIDVRGWNGQTMLQTSLNTDFFEEEATADIVSFLLRHGADVNARDSSLSTPLHYALGCGNVEAAQLLLESGADIEARNNQGKTPLYMEMEIMWLNLEARARDVTQLLLERGANVNAQDNDGATPLITAAEAYSVDISSTLLEHGAEPNMKNKNGESPLHRLSAHARSKYNNSHCCLARLLLRHGANVNDKDKDQTTPLHLATKARSYDIAKVFLEHDAEPNVANMDGNTPLHLAIKPTSDNFYRLDDAEVLTAYCVWPLLEHGADVNAMDKDHRTPLLLAIQQKMYDISRILLSRGAGPNVKDDRGKTPLHLLIESDFSDDDDISDLARLLLDRGASVNSQDQNHATPLLLAAERHMDDIARILIVYGADPNVKNMWGKTPLHLLLERTSNDHDDIHGFLVVERLLLERGADVHAQDGNNTTPVHLAYRHRRFEIAQLILDRSNAETDRRMVQLHVSLEGEYN